MSIMSAATRLAWIVLQMIPAATLVPNLGIAEPSDAQISPDNAEMTTPKERAAAAARSWLPQNAVKDAELVEVREYDAWTVGDWGSSWVVVFTPKGRPGPGGFEVYVSKETYRVTSAHWGQ